ncbi:MAG TPA: carboxypeptidase regulatory-like domain-containing protein [Candidatus Acidoferrum sp.]|nr:carboxypeptidase regulatory-like domain-containing protein [Candidatus Acidoferrum sp.]
MSRLGLRWVFGALVCALGLSCAARRVVAQNFHGGLVGTIEDATGARIVSANVTVQAAEAGSVQRKATSDTQGQFRIDDLLPGAYRVSVKATGFADATSEVTIVVSTVKEVTVTLYPAAMQQTVNVQGQASSITTQPIDTTSAVHQTAVTAQDLETVPLAARSFANIAYLAPGTEPVEPSDPTKARITAVSTGGSSGLNNELSVDGGDNSDDYIGGFLQNFSPDAIQEFAMRTAGEDADTGRTTAASVVITTKRGTNDWHGDAAFYDRQAALNARFPIENPAPDPKQPFSRQNYLGTIGGPIVRDKVWFFSSLEYVHENASIAYSPASQTQLNALAQLAQMGLVDVNGETVSSIAVPNSVPVPFRDYLATTRFDWAQSARSQWFLRAAIDNYLTHNALVAQAALPSTGVEQHNNYMNMVISNQFTFSPTWLGSFVFDASGLHLTAARNSDLGFALAFPFTATTATISGFETFGDNQFVTPITAFPVLRNQEKYQFRYEVTHTTGAHSIRFGVNFIHEPVLSGVLPGNQETLVTFGENPSDYLANPQQFTDDLSLCTASPSPNANPGSSCGITPAGDGSFGQNVQRLGLYAEDSWRVTPRLTVSYGFRYDRSFGLLTASGQSQLQNPAYLTLKALQIPLLNGAPHDFNGAVGPRLGIVYGVGPSENTVIRAGIGIYSNDLAQNGWVPALQAVNTPPGACVNPGDPGCLPPASSTGPIGTVAGSGAIIAPNYKTPYSLHVTGGAEHAFNPNWTISADYTYEKGNHGFARYQYQAGFTLFSPLFSPGNGCPTSEDAIDCQRDNVPNVTVFRSDNRSAYNALMIHLQGNVSKRFNLVANYTLSRADTWGCILGELFDYVDGVCDPLHPFAPGNYGPSGEDITHRFVLAGTFHVPGGFELTTLTQAESARPLTLTTTTPVTGLGDGVDDRAVVNGVPTTLDELRGTPYIQVDLRVSRPFRVADRWSVTPFVEFFNLFNRNNPGANYVTDVGALPVPPTEVAAGNVTDLCTNADCTTTTPITSLNQLRVPAGGLGDFFGPGTTVGIPFAAQIGARVTF